MIRTERLLDLVALLLDAKEPVDWAAIRETFPEEYATGTDEACERKFERDKAELAELGIGLDYRPPDDEGREGYVLRRDDYFIPEIGFSPEEMAVLYAAGSAALASGAFPGREDLAHALRKIALVSAEDPERVPPRIFVDHGKGKDRVASHLEALWQALVSRKRVTLRYRGAGREEETTREVDSYGVCLRRGVWVLYGYCHLRKDHRLFHVDRIAALRVNTVKPRSPDYEVPPDFDVADIAREQVWEHRFHPPVAVTVALSGELAPLSARLFPGGTVAPAREGVSVCLRVTFLDGLLRRVLSLGEGAQVVSPPQAVSRARQMLALVAKGHASSRERAA